MGDGPAAPGTPPGEGPSGRPQPLSIRLLGAGVRGARTFTKAAGLDRAIETAAEEAMVAAVESEAVERALVRVLQGPVVEEAVQGALESESVKRALIEALDSELVDEVWRRLLASDEAQRLVERIAEAPELRAAISAQSVGFVEDLGRTVGETTRRLDDMLERLLRRIFLRPPRAAPSDRAGAVTRALALGLDALIVNLAFSGLAAIAALIGSALWGSRVSTVALALGGAAWLALGGVYLVALWSMAGQTLGMRFFGIGLAGERGMPVLRAIVRLFGIVLAALPLGLGFLGVLFEERRRGWHDRLAGTEVVYMAAAPAGAPWSRFETAEAAATEAAKAPERRGLPPRQMTRPRALGG